MVQKRKRLDVRDAQAPAQNQSLRRHGKGRRRLATDTTPDQELTGFDGRGGTKLDNYATQLLERTSSDAFVLPTELPFADQLVLFQQVQEILEEMCIRVGLVICPAVMAKQGWTQPKSLELHKWIHYLSNVSAQRTDFPIRVNREERKKLLREVASIRHRVVHRLPQSISSMRTSLSAAVAFADLHHDSVAKVAISRTIEIVNETFHEVTSQQDLLHKSLKRQLDKALAQQQALLRRAQGSAGEQNQRMLAQAGEKMVRLLSLAGELDDVPRLHSAASAYVEGYSDPSDIEEVEVALLEAERVVTAAETVGEGLSRRSSN